MEDHQVSQCKFFWQGQAGESTQKREIRLSSMNWVTGSCQSYNIECKWSEQSSVMFLLHDLRTFTLRPFQDKSWTAASADLRSEVRHSAAHTAEFAGMILKIFIYSNTFGLIVSRKRSERHQSMRNASPSSHMKSVNTFRPFSIFRRSKPIIRGRTNHGVLVKVLML